MSLHWPAPGTLVVITHDDVRREYHDVSTYEAQQILDTQYSKAAVREAIYKPYPISMEPTT